MATFNGLPINTVIDAFLNAYGTEYERYIHLAAAALHNDWLKEFIKSNNNIYTERWKETKAEYASHPSVVIKNDKYMINIAVSYDQLTPDWQESNYNMASFVFKLLKENEKHFEDWFCNLIHEFWLSNNSWAKGGPLGVKYSLLPEIEKNKDKLVYKICKNYYNGYIYNTFF
jgi:hypothetical protein